MGEKIPWSGFVSLHDYKYNSVSVQPVAPVAQRYLIFLTRWDESSIPANGIFLTKKIKNKNKNAQRVEND